MRIAALSYLSLFRLTDGPPHIANQAGTKGCFWGEKMEKQLVPYY